MDERTIKTQTPSGKSVVIVLSDNEGFRASAEIAEISLSGELQIGFQGQIGSAMVKIADKLVLIPMSVELEIKSYRAAVVVRYARDPRETETLGDIERDAERDENYSSTPEYGSRRSAVLNRAGTARREPVAQSGAVELERY